MAVAPQHSNNHRTPPIDMSRLTERQAHVVRLTLCGYTPGDIVSLKNCLEKCTEDGIAKLLQRAALRLSA
jgi:DNA-binding NarL/FixJ family response regulator